jgi:Cytosine specific DNA methyltransferase replication foci domain
MFTAPQFRKSSSWKNKQVSITVSNVGRYAFGYDEDHRMVLWAAGGAGWYILSPSEQYRAIFDYMREAVKAWYFTVDTYKTVDKLDPKGLFTKYSIAYRLKLHIVEELFKRHALFIYSNMGVDKEELAWRIRHQPIYEWMRSNVVGHASTLEIEDSYNM